MYTRYRREEGRGFSSYRLAEEGFPYFGCRQGIIPWLLRKRIPPAQEEPYRWHLPVRDSLNGARWGSTDYSGSALIIDLKPKQRGSNLSLYEISDVWGYSDFGWSPILLRLSGLFIDEDPKTANRERFVLKAATEWSRFTSSCILPEAWRMGNWTAPGRRLR